MHVSIQPAAANCLGGILMIDSSAQYEALFSTDLPTLHLPGALKMVHNREQQYCCTRLIDEFR